MNESTTENIIQKAHQEALKKNAVALYLANEMSGEDALRFEEHYFECPDCAQAVKSGQQLMAGIRNLDPTDIAELVASPAAGAWWQRWVSLAPIPVAAAFAGVVAYQNWVTIPALRADAMPQADTVIHAREREMGTPAAAKPLATDSITIVFDKPKSEVFPYYLVRVTRDRVNIISTVAPDSPGDNTISLHVSKHALGSGTIGASLTGLKDKNAADGKPLLDYDVTNIP